MRHVFGIYALGGMDTLFFNDDTKNRANIVTAIIYKRSNFDKMKAHYIKNGIVPFRKMRSKIWKFLGRYHFKIIDEDVTKYIVRMDSHMKNE
jgi:hypothetical protein